MIVELEFSDVEQFPPSLDEEVVVLLEDGDSTIGIFDGRFGDGDRWFLSNRKNPQDGGPSVIAWAHRPKQALKIAPVTFPELIDALCKKP